MTNSRAFEMARSSLSNRPRSGSLVPDPLDLPALWEQLADLLGTITGSAPMTIFCYDPASNQYTLRLARGTAAQAETGPSLDSSIPRWLGTHDLPLYVVDGEVQAGSHALEQEELQVPEDIELLVPLRGEWGVPEDRPRGWVALGPRPGSKPYNPQDLRLMAAVVDRAALTVENHQLQEGMAGLDRSGVEFMDFVAHELKQPMTSVKGYAKMLTLGIGGELTETQSKFVQVITANVDRMGKLIDDLLEISRLESGRIKLAPEHLQPREILDQALATTKSEAEARQHTLEVNVPGDLPLITGDRNRLLQILGYLLSNACRYTPDGGAIRISVSEPVPAAASPGYLWFSISDTGIGISPEDLVRLDKFYRADHDLVISQPGLGLGISIARGLIALHGGELTIESEVDRGSTFSFTVPIAQDNGD